MRIDAHQHFWSLTNSFCTWPTPEERAIYRDFTTADLAPLLAEHEIGGTILVQAAPDLAETKDLLALGDAHHFIKGVVGWIDMGNVHGQGDLKALSAHPKFKGIRPMLQSIPDPLWMLDHAFDGIYETLSGKHLTFDALITPLHLEALRVLAARYPDLAIIIDHGAKPQIRNGLHGARGFDEWAPGIALFADQKNVSCKISGLLTEAAPAADLPSLIPYLDHLYDVFGPDRLMWGSDWPVLNLAADYAGWMNMCETWLGSKPEVARIKIQGTTAARVYRLDAAAGDL